MSGTLLNPDTVGLVALRFDLVVYLAERHRPPMRRRGTLWLHLSSRKLLVDSCPSALRKQMSGGCYNNRHVDLGSFRVDDDFVFIAVYALLRSVALRLAGSCGPISAANAGVGEPLLASQRTRGKA